MQDLYALSQPPDRIFEQLVAQKEAFAKQCFGLVLEDHLGDHG